MPAKVSYGELCKACLWLGLTAYGGPAMVGYVREVMVERRRWVEPERFKEGLALSQIVPGATLTQVISYVGLVVKGPAGAGVAAICFILPGALIVLGVSALYFRWQEFPLVQMLSRGVGAVVIAILAYACLKLAKTSLPSVSSALIALVACAAYLVRINAFLVVIAAAAAAWLLSRKGQAPVAPPGAAESGIGRVAPRAWAALLLVACVALAGIWMVAPMVGRLCLAFLGIGSVAFGGGYSMIPLIQQQVVDNLGLLSIRAFMDGIALGQITPGPIMLTATFIGYAAGGSFGALAATAAIFSPSVVILVAAAPGFQAWGRRRAAQAMIGGIVASFVGMLLSILVRFGGVTLTDAPSIVLSAAAFIALCCGVDLPFVVAAGLLLSLMLFR
jgi:chromate transporter